MLFLLIIGQQERYHQWSLATTSRLVGIELIIREVNYLHQQITATGDKMNAIPVAGQQC